MLEMQRKTTLVARRTRNITQCAAHNAINTVQATHRKQAAEQGG